MSLKKILPAFGFGQSDDGESTNGDYRRSRSIFKLGGRSKSRSPSPYAGRGSRNRSPSTDRDATGGAASDYASDGGESDSYPNSSSEKLPRSSSNAYLTDESSDAGSETGGSEDENGAAIDEEDIDDLDPEVIANTEANAGSGTTPADYLLAQPALLGNPEGDAGEDGPNLVKLPASPFGSQHPSDGSPRPSTSSDTTAVATVPTPRSSTSGNDGGPALSTMPSSAASSNTVAAPSPFSSTAAPRMRRRKSTLKADIGLNASRLIYERNRCTITLTHGDPDGHKENDGSRKPRKSKTYVVASDLSEESYYAVEWAIGTVLRNGDDLLLVTVMETDSKLDPEDPSSQDKASKIRNQQERQTRVLQLSREATQLLERTRLHVRVVCQAIHAKNSRHMIVDLVDYTNPSLLIVGTRGLSHLKGVILGSVSHYLIQKSSVPVMVTRRRLKPVRRARRPISDLQRQPRVEGLANAGVEKESHAAVIPSSKDGAGEDEDKRENRMDEGDGEGKGKNITDTPEGEGVNNDSSLSLPGTASRSETPSKEEEKTKQLPLPPSRADSNASDIVMSLTAATPEESEKRVE